MVNRKRKFVPLSTLKPVKNTNLAPSFSVTMSNLKVVTDEGSDSLDTVCSSGPLSVAPEQHPVVSSRNGWIDYARGIAIIMVVVGHITGGFRKIQHDGFSLQVDYFLDEFFTLLYGARMPLFFVISGLFIENSFRKRRLPAFVSYKFSTILYPFLIWASIQLLFQLVGNKFGASATERSAKDFLFLFYQPHKLDQFWFLYVLFEVAVIYALLRHFFRLHRVVFLLIGITAYIVYYQIPDHLFIFGIKYVCKFLFYLALGNFISPYVLERSNQKHFASWGSTILLTALFFLLRFLMKYLGFTESEMDVRLFSFENFLLLAVVFAGLALILNVSFLLERLGVLTWLKTIGKYSLYIYCMHILTAGIARYLILKVTNYQFPSLSYYLLCAVSVLVPVMIAKMLNRYNLEFFFTLEINKKH